MYTCRSSLSINSRNTYIKKESEVYGDVQNVSIKIQIIRFSHFHVFVRLFSRVSTRPVNKKGLKNSPPCNTNAYLTCQESGLLWLPWWN